MDSLTVARYERAGQAHYGVLADGVLERLVGSPFEGIFKSGDRDRLDAVRLLPPMAQPRIFGLGYNYKAHSQESQKAVPEIPVVFMKPSTCVVGHEDAIVYPPHGENIHFEGELTVVVGKTARHVAEADALDYVFGYTCGNDVSD